MAPWPHPDEGALLPVEDLAMRLLETMSANGSQSRRSLIVRDHDTYWGGFQMAGVQSSRPKIGHREWSQRLSVAVDWLYVNGLIALDWEQSSDWFFVTDLGRRTLEAPDGRKFFNAHKSLAVELHPSIAARVRRLFLMGEIEPAVVAALRQVEIAVREAAGAGKGDIGKKLMASAFKPGEGPLADPNLEPAEQEGVMYLYMGLIGAFKNTSSHHQVDFDDPTEAAEVILFADLLLRMLDRTGS